jgi:hypothetical protein
MQTQKSKVKTQNAKVKSASSLGFDFSVLHAASGRSAEPSPRSRLWCRKASSVLTFAFCVLTFAFAFCLMPTVLSAQGCAMCYNSASAAKAGAKEALANGVLILLVPPMVFFALITVVVYRYRNKFRELSVVSGPLSVARRPDDREYWRSDEPGAEAPGLDYWSPDHPIIGSPDSLPRATDN